MHHTPVPVLARKATALVLVFFIVILILLTAVFMVSRGENAYSSLWDRLHPSFFCQTAVIVILSSLLYTPFSYGISRFFIVGSRRQATLRDLFYLFGKPRVFCKAVLMRVAIWAMRGAWQVAALIAGIAAQGLIYILTLAGQGKNVMNMSVQDLFRQVRYAVVSQRFVALSVLIWAGFLLTLAFLYVRYMFCKYALLTFETLHVSEAIRIGLLATRGRLFFIMRRYLSFLAYCICIFLSFGLLYRVLKPYREESFSLFARRLVIRSRDAYFLARG